MQSVVPWILIVINLIAAYPSAVWLLWRSGADQDPWLKLALTVGLSAGCLSQVMLWESLAGIPFDAGLITLSYLAILLPGIGWWWRKGRQNGFVSAKPPQDTTGNDKTPVPRLAIVIVGVVAAAIFFNAVYWPFYQSDALGIYAAQASYLKTSRALIPLRYDNFSYYQAYPMLVQLNYAYQYLVSGWENGYVAKVIPTLLSLGCLAATYSLGTTLYGRKAGWLAAVLLAVTPQFARWGSSGYVDLPMAFYCTLAALFGWRAYVNERGIDAVLMGLMIGLAAWTKNAGLVGIALFVIWLAYLWLTQRIGFRVMCVALIVCGLVAAPWYIRNWVEAQLIIPDTAWTEQAGRTVNNLLVFITRPENFGITGWLIVGGVGRALYKTIRRWRVAEREILLILFAVPFFGLWWLLVSYDPRFLLLFLPLLTILAAQWGLDVWERMTKPQQTWLRPVIFVFAAAMTLYSVWISVAFKDDLLRNPLMDDKAKQEVVAAQRGS